MLTTNLDAQRPVVWNMGEIALNRSPEATELFRKVILASAAIPAAFPPVKIEVEADGKIYDELHVDGGTTREVFVSPVEAPLAAFNSLYPTPPIRRYFIIKNGKATPEQEVVKPTTLQIAARSISTLIKSQNQGELYQIYRVALMAAPISILWRCRRRSICRPKKSTIRNTRPHSMRKASPKAARERWLSRHRDKRPRHRIAAHPRTAASTVAPAGSGPK